MAPLGCKRCNVFGRFAGKKKQKARRQIALRRARVQKLIVYLFGFFFTASCFGSPAVVVFAAS